MFKNSEIQEGIEWAITNNYYNLLRIFPIPDIWKAFRRVEDFKLYPLEGCETDEQLKQIKNMNDRFLYELEDFLKIKSLYKLESYIYELITTIQTK